MREPVRNARLDGIGISASVVGALVGATVRAEAIRGGAQIVARMATTDARFTIVKFVLTCVEVRMSPAVTGHP